MFLKSLKAYRASSVFKWGLDRQAEFTNVITWDINRRIKTSRLQSVQGRKAVIAKESEIAPLWLMIKWHLTYECPAVRSRCLNINCISLGDEKVFFPCKFQYQSINEIRKMDFILHVRWLSIIVKILMKTHKAKCRTLNWQWSLARSKRRW